MRYYIAALAVLSLCVMLGCRDTKAEETVPPPTASAAPTQTAVPDAPTAGPATEAKAAEGGAAAGKEIAWLDDLDQAMALARQQNKPIVTDFWATWCGPCKRMEETTWRDPKVIAAAAGFVMVKLDVDKATAAAQKYQVDSIPTIAVMDADGKVTKQQVGYTEADELLKLMRAARQGGGRQSRLPGAVGR
jgi:thiol:disulfide interchange protein